jgi:hypothetical protein
VPKFLKLPSILLSYLLVFAAAHLGVAQQPVVIELFTSEGCSSCPPAEAMLTKLSTQRDTSIAHLILLEEHVTYWNSSKFTDRFSNQQFTDRQAAYVKDMRLETEYTPQVVIDGHLQTSGNKPATVQQLILQQAKESKPTTVSLKLVSPDRLDVIVQGPAGTKAQVLFAVTEDHLVTDVHGGENQGRTLQHDAVVRVMESLGTLSNGQLEKTVKIPTNREWKGTDLRAIVLVQDKNSGAMLGAATLPLSN